MSLDAQVGIDRRREALRCTVLVSPLSRWALSPDIVHLNHGSFGGCLRTTLASADAARARLEAAPMHYFRRDWQPDLDAARAALAAFVNADPARLVFVPSATAGVAVALAAASETLSAGDEILTTTHLYAACRYQLTRLADARGCRVIFVDTPLPFDPDQFVERTAAAITPRTRLALFDHITSPTALVYPLDRLLPLCADIPTIVDGAHAPGQVPLDLAALDATWYVGNNHKWLCAPKASGFLVTSAPTRPLVVSHGANPTYGPANRFHAELDWAGTYDPSAVLAVATAITDLDTEAGGWPALYARNHALALDLRDALTTTHLAPDSSLGSMAAMPLALPPNTSPLQLEERLLAAGWEVPIVDFPGQPLLRVSAHLYNAPSQADDLARVLHGLGARVC